MSFRTLILIPVLLVAVASAQALERMEERSFATSGVAVLRIKAYAGSITIESSDDPIMRAKVVANSTLEEGTAAETALRNLELTWRQEGDTITLEATNPSETSARFAWQEAIRLGVEIKFTVPRQCQLDLATGRGEVRIGEIKGEVRVKNGKGLIFCRFVDGAVTADNASGDIVVSHCTGDVELRSRQGGVRTGRIGGHATVSAVSGDIDVMSAIRGLAVSVDGGDAVAGIPRQFSGEGSLRSAGGSITLKIDPAANLDLDASSVWGRVRKLTAKPLNLLLEIGSGGLGQKSLVGRVNGGGAHIQARANGGHVNLTGVVTPFSEE